MKTFPRARITESVKSEVENCSISLLIISARSTKRRKPSTHSHWGQGCQIGPAFPATQCDTGTPAARSASSTELAFSFTKPNIWNQLLGLLLQPGPERHQREIQTEAHLWWAHGPPRVSMALCEAAAHSRGAQEHHSRRSTCFHEGQLYC